MSVTMATCTCSLYNTELHTRTLTLETLFAESPARASKTKTYICVSDRMQDIERFHFIAISSHHIYAILRQLLNFRSILTHRRQL